MEINRKELDGLIMSEVVKQDKKLQLENKIKNIQKELTLLNEGPENIYTPEPAVAEEEVSIFDDTKPGSILILNFQDCTIKMQRQLDDLFKITDAAESKKLKEGDYIKIQGNDLLQKGKRVKFVILREALKYESNSLNSWRIIKN